MKRVLVWFRKDLRLSDHPCLEEAVRQDAEVLPVFVWNNSGENPWEPGAASRWWLQKALNRLRFDIQTRFGQLLVLQGNPSDLLVKLAHENHCESIFFGRDYDSFGLKEEDLVRSALQRTGITCKSFNTKLIAEPWEIQNENGTGFRGFTKFWSQCRQHLPSEIGDYPLSKIRFISEVQVSLSAHTPAFFKKLHWHHKLEHHWEVSEWAALRQLEYAIEHILKPYRYRRNLPSQAGTSKLSPYLAWGLISPKRITHEILKARNEDNRDGASKFLTEIGWREFAYHLLYHQPEITDHSLKVKFENFPNRIDPELLNKWKTGMTGFPLVDAGMRELWETGWMHNRTRMLVASFLVKNLLIPWQVGAKWFWDTLVDADLANNSAGWQWSASSGVDYRFRVFNPHLQGVKFDAKGEYVRKWVPELYRFSGRQIHSAEEAELLQATGYPASCVDYSESRNRAFALLNILTSVGA